MSSTFGRKLRLSLFGESHGGGIGIVLDGFPPGLRVDMPALLAETARRAPGSSDLTTPRKEADTPEFLSGLLDGVTTGAPLCALIRNTDTRSADYAEVARVPRPGHADLTAHIKFGGFADPRGGGHFSGRLTAPLVVAGALCKQFLAAKSITATASPVQVGVVCDPNNASPDLTPAMADEIRRAKADGDSVGGVIQGVLKGLPIGLGAPFFGSCESDLAAMFFSIPAVKGVEFGAGFGCATLRGSVCNDPIRYIDGKIAVSSNNSGGIQGGITNGNPLVARVAFRPTPTIAKEQQSVDLVAHKNAVLRGKGRHDPCIIPRAVVVVEAAMAICAVDWMICAALAR